jgi:hypothetical protein
VKRMLFSAAALRMFLLVWFSCGPPGVVRGQAGIQSVKA